MGQPKPKDLDPSIGVCVKSSDRKIEFQNESCKTMCGDHLGSICETGCMSRRPRLVSDESLDLGVTLQKGLSTSTGLADAVVVNDGTVITTLLFDRTKQIKQQLDFLNKFDLTKSEAQIAALILEGKSNREVANRLYISKKTLRTHLNNIYKKLPEQVRAEIMRLGSRSPDK